MVPTRSALENARNGKKSNEPMKTPPAACRSRSWDSTSRNPSYCLENASTNGSSSSGDNSVKKRVQHFLESTGVGRPVSVRTVVTDLLCSLKSTPPQRVLIIQRPGSDEVWEWSQYLAKLLIDEWGVKVLVEPQIAEEFKAQAPSKHHRGMIETWTLDTPMTEVVQMTDFVACLGGDGTLLWVSNLFPSSMPPVVGFSMGSLGYLTQFDFRVMAAVIRNVMQMPFLVNLRCRLRVCVVDEEQDMVEELCALNECVVDRGRCSNLCELNVFWNDEFFTCVSADGLIIATPTGSTGYSMSAGGSIVHPTVSCLLFTPICPHSLSFRPVLLPICSTLRVELSPASRASSAWVAVDGKSQIELCRRMSVTISASDFPFPMVVPGNASQDKWAMSLTNNLNWNKGIRLKSVTKSPPS